MEPTGRYTFTVYYERLGSDRKDWMKKEISVNSNIPRTAAQLRTLFETQARRWRGQIEGSNPRFAGMYGDIRRIKVTSID